MENLKQIITIASACVGLLATITGFLIPLVKNVKAKNRLSALNKLATTLQSLIVDAETFTHFTGAEKKEYVLTKANRYALENNIPFDEASVDAEIEKMVKLSKNVNVSTSRRSTAEDTTPTDKYRIG